MPEQQNMPPSTKAVVLLNFGGPRNLEEVPEFLYEILRDPNTIQLPFPYKLQDRLARRISSKRASKVVKEYGEMGGKSPIIEATENQRCKLEEALRQKHSMVQTFVAHRYIPGFTKEVIKQIKEANIEKLFLIPMYPHYSRSTTGSSVEQFMQELEKENYAGVVQALYSYPDHPLYIEALCEQFRKCIDHYGLVPQNTRILCSAHGLPQSYVTNGDPYVIELYRTLEALRRFFPEWQFQLCFQSRVGPAKWLQPYTDEVIQELPQEGVQKVLFFPISFVNDHLETLYEIDKTYFDLAKSVGLEPYRVEALECHPKFVNLLSEQTILWEKKVLGIAPRWLLPPSQQFKRYDQWILFGWITAFLIALFFAIV